jgi:membrane protein required for colicin V production
MLDVILLLLFIIIVSHAGLQGFIKDFTSTSWFFAGLLFAFSFYRTGAVFIRSKMLHGAKYLPEIIAFFFLFVIIHIIIKTIGSMLKNIIQLSGLTAFDKALGVFFGLFKGIVVIAATLYIIKIQPLFDGDLLLKNSVIAKFLMPNREFIEKVMDMHNV